MDPNPPLLSETRGHITVFHVRVECKPLHIIDEYDRVWREFVIFYTIHSDKPNNKIAKKNIYHTLRTAKQTNHKFTELDKNDTRNI